MIHVTGMCKTAVTVTGTSAGDLTGLWPLFGLLTETPRLQPPLPPEDEMSALAEGHARPPARTSP